MQRSTKSGWCPAAAKRFEISQGDGSIAGYFAPGMQYRLGAVEMFRRLPENFQGVVFHIITLGTGGTSLLT